MFIQEPEKTSRKENQGSRREVGSKKKEDNVSSAKHLRKNKVCYYFMFFNVLVGEVPSPPLPLRKILIRRQLLLKTHPHHRLLAMFTVKWDLGLLVEGTT